MLPETRGLSYASSGLGAPGHLAGELFQAMAGVNMVRVPYKGTSPGVMSVVMGETDGAEPMTSTPEAFAGLIRTETEKWSKVIKQAGIKPE